MHALQMRGINNLVRTEISIPTPGPGEVLIKTQAATICTSDIHDIKSNPFGIKLPRVLGHEGAGVIVECGPGVENLSVGTRVAVHPVIPCGFCDECKRGFDHICTNMGHLGYDRDGCFGEYFVQRADRMVAVPDQVSDSLAALLEPVAVCLQAIARAGDIKGRKVLIVGDGPFGNIIARLARRAGASKVWVSGREPFRLKMIPDIEIWETNTQEKADIAILAVSSSDAVTTCLSALRPRGRLVVFSSLKDAVPVDLFKVHLSELEIVGACNDESRIEESLLCLTDPGLALEELITHKIPFDNWEEGFTLARDGHNKTLKVALIF